VRSVRFKSFSINLDSAIYFDSSINFDALSSARFVVVIMARRTDGSNIIYFFDANRCNSIMVNCTITITVASRATIRRPFFIGRIIGLSVSSLVRTSHDPRHFWHFDLFCCANLGL